MKTKQTPKDGRQAKAASKLALVTISMSAEEIARWKVRAQADNRSLSSWIRLRLLAMDAIDEERATRAAELRDRA